MVCAHNWPAVGTYIYAVNIPVDDIGAEFVGVPLRVTGVDTEAWEYPIRAVRLDNPARDNIWNYAALLQREYRLAEPDEVLRWCLDNGVEQILEGMH